MRNIKLVLLPMLVTFGLLMTGFAYACWSQTLYIKGTVTSNTLKVRYLSASADDSGGEMDNIDIGKDKDVGRAAAWVADDNHVEVRIYNAYPCYETYVHFTVLNEGMPVNFKGFGPENFVYDPASGRWKATLFGGDITVHGWDTENEQLDPGWTKDYTVWIHVEQSAEENTTYDFTIEVLYEQWNCGYIVEVDKG